MHMALTLKMRPIFEVNLNLNLIMLILIRCLIICCLLLMLIIHLLMLHLLMHYWHWLIIHRGTLFMVTELCINPMPLLDSLLQLALMLLPLCLNLS